MVPSTLALSEIPLNDKVLMKRCRFSKGRKKKFEIKQKKMEKKIENQQNKIKKDRENEGRSEKISRETRYNTNE